MTFRPSVVLFALLWMGAPEISEAQRLPSLPLSLEVRGGLAVPVGDFADGNVKAENGPTFGAGAVFHATRAIGIFAGYSRTAFGCGECALFDVEDEVVDEGFDAGVQIEPETRFAGVRPWIRGGAVAHELSFSGANGGSVSSETAIGFGVGAGVSLSPVPSLPSLRVSPGLHFRAYSADFPLGELEDRSVDVSHVTVDVGLAYRF